jgi:HEAT repeat protein
MAGLAWCPVAVIAAFGMGPALAPAVDEKPLPELLKQLKSKDPEERIEAAKAIGDLREKAKSAIPSLLELNKDRESRVRYQAVEALYDICVNARGQGPEVKMAVTVLIASLKDKTAADNENFDVLCKVMDVLSLIAEQEPSYGKPVATAVIPFLKHDVDVVRHFAVSALENLKDAAKPAVPRLIEMAKGKDEGDRDKALGALGVIDPEAAKKAGLKLP